jgi:hypothetical protein
VCRCSQHVLEKVAWHWSTKESTLAVPSIEDRLKNCPGRGVHDKGLSSW